MSYTWTDGEIITAEKLNIAPILVVKSNTIDNDGQMTEILDHTWEEIYKVLSSGGVCMMDSINPTNNDHSLEIIKNWSGNASTGRIGWWGDDSPIIYIAASPDAYPSYTLD